MGESTACLLSSYSQPSPETKQGDPFPCLTSSISFGRYVSESLDWEKWSTFRENRYMEDVKKYSRPGSVAQMKAHFEAHYKRKAAQRAVALLEQDNEVNRSNFNQVSMQMDNHVARGNTAQEKADINKVCDSVEVSRCAPPPLGEGQGPEGAQFVEVEENQLIDHVDISNHLETVEDVQASGCNQNIDGRRQDHTQFPLVENPLTSDQEDVSDQFKKVEDSGKGAKGEDGKKQSKGIGELGDPASASSDNRKPVFTRVKSRGHIGVPKPPAPPKPSVPIHKRPYRKANSSSRENTADFENKKAKTRSIHMSIDLAPEEFKKQLSPILQRLVNSRIVKTLAGKAAQATQGKPLRDTVDIPARPAVSLQQRKLSSKSPGTCSRNVQSPTVSRPFIFRSEERAAKRKEYFERLVQNAKAKETEKEKQQGNSKVKARNDFKHMPLLATSKIGPGSDPFRPRTLNDASKVIPALPCSPFVRGETLKDNDARSPWMKDNDARPPWRNTASCKEVRGKNNQSPAFSLKSVSKKSTSENASPNIQV